MLEHGQPSGFAPWRRVKHMVMTACIVCPVTNLNPTNGLVWSFHNSKVPKRAPSFPKGAKRHQPSLTFSRKRLRATGVAQSDSVQWSRLRWCWRARRPSLRRGRSMRWRARSSCHTPRSPASHRMIAGPSRSPCKIEAEEAAASIVARTAAGTIAAAGTTRLARWGATIHSAGAGIPLAAWAEEEAAPIRLALSWEADVAVAAWADEADRREAAWADHSEAQSRAHEARVA